MEAGAVFSIPLLNEDVTRSLYSYQGDSFMIEEMEIKASHLVELDPNQETTIVNGNTEGYYLLLQGRPINEPLVQYGPHPIYLKH